MKSIDRTLEQNIRNFRASSTGLSSVEVAPALQVAAFHKGQKVCELKHGPQFEYFDWASLTKAVFTTSACMWAVDDSKPGLFRDPARVRLGDPLEHLLPDFSEWAEQISLSSLLTHTAGLTWWIPFFQSLPHPDRVEVSVIDRWDLVVRKLRNQVVQLQSEEASKPKQAGSIGPLRSVYSDLSFFVLGEVLCRVFNRPLLEIWESVRERLELDSGFFTQLSSAGGSSGLRAQKDVSERTAPTEWDRTYRNRLLQGEVHDENTAALGGIAPHSGLFGTLSDLGRFGLEVRNLCLKKKSKLPAAGQRFVRRAVSKEIGDWGLGFMMPAPSGSTAGSLFHPSSVGHTGFTGTSFWYDPKRDLLVTILSNRVHPTREKRGFEELRPSIHNWIVQAVDEG